MKKNKAQSAIEFLILVGAVFFFVVTLTGIFQQNISEKTIEKRNFEIQELALAAQNELNIAAKATDGYRREFYLQEKVAGIDYEINLIGSFVYFNTSDGRHTIGIPGQNATGNFVKGTNVIEKQNGIIILN
ncbi:MAG: hypothetical protein KJ600_03435 [Nanoarchaeota archaeon]|nr:hypothetical protein [Nanoarchaeota archaeon]MBU1103580.1 hypothetical protein [Nanoarchaeota archaeon]